MHAVSSKSEVVQKLADLFHQSTIHTIWLAEVVLVLVLLVVVMAMAMRPLQYLTSLHARFVGEPWLKVVKPRPFNREMARLIASYEIKGPVLLAVPEDHIPAPTVLVFAAWEARIPGLEFMTVAATVAEAGRHRQRTPRNMAVDGAKVDHRDWSTVRSFGRFR